MRNNIFVPLSARLCNASARCVMRDRTKLAQQVIEAVRTRVPHLAPRDRVGVALAVLDVPRIRAALELHDLKELVDG